VAEALRGVLPDVVHRRHLGRRADQGQPVLVVLGRQRLFQLVRPVEVVLDRRLAAPGDHQHVGETRA
jgi:hypothetical protein